jgi:hypothetical protein
MLIGDHNAVSLEDAPHYQTAAHLLGFTPAICCAIRGTHEGGKASGVNMRMAPSCAAASPAIASNLPGGWYSVPLQVPPAAVGSSSSWQQQQQQQQGQMFMH